MENNQNKQDLQVQLNLPNDVKVFYTDSTFLSINQYGVILDVAQTMGTTNQQTVVTRIGMSKEHARVLIERLGGLLAQDSLKRQIVTHSPSKKDVIN